MTNFLELVKEQAKNNQKRIDSTIRILQGAAMVLFEKTDLDTGWRYELESDSFKREFKYHEIGTTDILRKTLIESQFHGVTLHGEYDHWEDKMWYEIHVPASCKDEKVQKLLEQLKARRRALKAQFCSLSEKIALTYFESHKDELLKTVGVFDTISSPDFIVWDNGDSKYKSDEQMRDSFKRKISHTKCESLDSFEEYDPILFTDDTTLSTSVRCGSFELKINRSYIVDETLTHYPEISVSFEMRTSSDTIWKNALDSLFWKKRAKESSAYFDFVKDMQNNSEWIMEDKVATCYVPIIHSEFAESVLKNAKTTYPDIQMEIVVKYIPLFDGEVTCIKCSL